MAHPDTTTTRRGQFATHANQGHRNPTDALYAWQKELFEQSLHSTRRKSANSAGKVPLGLLPVVNTMWTPTDSSTSLFHRCCGTDSARCSCTARDTLKFPVYSRASIEGADTRLETGTLRPWSCGLRLTLNYSPGAHPSPQTCPQSRKRFQV